MNKQKEMVLHAAHHKSQICPAQSVGGLKATQIAGRQGTKES